MNLLKLKTLRRQEKGQIKSATQDCKKSIMANDLTKILTLDGAQWQGKIHANDPDLLLCSIVELGWGELS